MKIKLAKTLNRYWRFLIIDVSQNGNISTRSDMFKGFYQGIEVGNVR